MPDFVIPMLLAVSRWGTGRLWCHSGTLGIAKAGRDVPAEEVVRQLYYLTHATLDLIFTDQHQGIPCSRVPVSLKDVDQELIGIAIMKPKGCTKPAIRSKVPVICIPVCVPDYTQKSASESRGFFRRVWWFTPANRPPLRPVPGTSRWPRGDSCLSGGPWRRPSNQGHLSRPLQ